MYKEFQDNFVIFKLNVSISTFENLFEEQTPVTQSHAGDDIPLCLTMCLFVSFRVLLFMLSFSSKLRFGNLLHTLVEIE